MVYNFIMYCMLSDKSWDCCLSLGLLIYFRGWVTLYVISMFQGAIRIHIQVTRNTYMRHVHAYENKCIKFDIR